MKKIIVLLVALCLCAACALAEAPQDVFTLWFEEGFGLTLPEGWVSYAVPETADGDPRYALGDGNGERFLYVALQETDLKDVDAVAAALERQAGCEVTGALRFGGQPFAAFILPGQNASGCTTLHDGALLTFLFTPQSDADYMLAMAEIMDSFAVNAL